MNSTNFNNNCENLLEDENSFCEKVSDDNVEIKYSNCGECDAYDECTKEMKDAKQIKGVRLSNRKDDEIVDDLQIKSKFNEVDLKLNNQENRLIKLECNMEMQSEILKSLVEDQKEVSKDVKNMNINLLNYSNNVFSSFNSLMSIKDTNDAKIETTKIEGRSKLYIQICILIGSIVATGGTVYLSVK